jgi:mannitol/fructose-specific phosphotransferase system IIA component (Ntr-type)
VMITNDKPVTWTQKEEQADIIISLMIPASNENQIHIKILAQVAQLMLDDSFVSLVRNAATSEEIFRAVEKLNCQY